MMPMMMSRKAWTVPIHDMAEEEEDMRAVW